MSQEMGRLDAAVAKSVQVLHRGFDDYNASFSDLSRRARRRFESGDRSGMRADATARIELYDRVVDEVIERLESDLGGRLFSRSVWSGIRDGFEADVGNRVDAELCKTFFNTITRRLFKTRGVDAAIEFIAIDIEPTDRISHPVARHVYAVAEDPALGFRRILDDHAFSLPYADVDQDARLLAEHLMAECARIDEPGPTHIELLETVFYREGRAYLVGRAFGRQRYLPCVVALVVENGKIRVDALLTRRLQVSILFGYTFSYFLADLPTVGDTVVFLRTLLPDKPVDELYTVLGRDKQGKTDRYRAFYRQFQALPDDQLVEAPGQRGMVMAVFTLPSYPLVFKLLRDRFHPAKTIRREEVIERYLMVYRHDRVGRLMDAQEFKDLRFPRQRFEPALLDQLLGECSRLVVCEGDDVVVRHCYVERRVRPLNLHLKEADESQAREAIIDMGQALKDLALSNIFAGDLLPKNFGVTRSGRVVFYDYDELMLLTDCHFRHLPKARDFDDIYSPTPWYPVDDNDLFPEEFPRFMAMAPEHLAVLHDVHPELFDPDWWLGIQARIRAGESLDVPPYNNQARLRPA